MSIEGNVTVLRYDARGQLQWRSDLTLDEALLAVLRFARTNPQATCTIELRESRGFEHYKAAERRMRLAVVAEERWERYGDALGGAS